ncbi:hypothetical protein GCM10023160_31790 [Brachybacterium paraconglomeratum]|uniref:hypothetical protein n=1 Tax=Brachybacterium paraconglomeratum TaxID=173362 RepID=UPI0031EA891D
MNEDTGSRDIGPRRSRAAASASALGATALLVLSFGPSALALTPSGPAASSVRAAISAPASATPAPATATPAVSVAPTNVRGAADEDDDVSR